MFIIKHNLMEAETLIFKNKGNTKACLKTLPFDQYLANVRR